MTNHIVVNIAWNSNGWVADPTAEDAKRSGFSHVRSGEVMHEDRNFLLTYAVRDGKKLGYGYMKGEPRSFDQGQGIVFFYSLNPHEGQAYLVGAYGRARANTDGGGPPDYDREWNIEAPVELVVGFDPDGYLPVDPARHMDGKKRPGQGGWAYIGDDAARSILEDAQAAQQDPDILARIRALQGEVGGPLLHDVVVMGAWPGVDDNYIDGFANKVGTTGAVAVWWSFSMLNGKPLRKELMERGFRVLLVRGGEARHYYRVVPGGVVDLASEGSSGFLPCPDDWAKHALPGDLTAPRSGTKTSQIPRLWFLADEGGDIEPSIRVSKDVANALGDEPLVMNQNGFRAGRLKGKHRFVPRGGSSETGMSKTTDPRVVRLREELHEKGQMVLYGPPGTGKTWLARQIAGLDEEAAAPEPRRCYVLVANPQGELQWHWDTLFEGDEPIDDWDATRTHRRHFRDARAGDLIFGYLAGSKGRCIYTAARVVHEVDWEDEEPVLPIERIEGIGPFPNPVTLHKLKADPVLAASAPVRTGFRATIQALEPEESLRLLELIAEANPKEAALLTPLVRTRARVPRAEVVTFHPSFAYEDFVEGIRPVLDSGPDASGGVRYELRRGIFADLCARADRHRDRAFYLLVDEINRANIPSVFGELITLLEKDKRSWLEEREDEVGAFSAGANPIRVRLPVSQKSFAVPPNLFVVGTMNTTDRAVALMDMALRRRFRFVAVRPDPNLIGVDAPIGKETAPPAATIHEALSDVVTLLQRLNRRIEERLGADFEVGHSYFLSLRGWDSPEEVRVRFASIWRGEVFPLLEEYFHDDRRWLSEELLGTAALQASLADSDRVVGELLTLLLDQLNDDADETSE